MCSQICVPDSYRAGKYRETLPSQIKNSELTISNTLSAILSFINPFFIVEKDKLFSLSSGAAVTSNIENDLLQAELSGQREKEKFINESFQNISSDGKLKDFFEAIPELKIQTMRANNKSLTYLVRRETISVPRAREFGILTFG